MGRFFFSLGQIKSVLGIRGVKIFSPGAETLFFLEFHHWLILWGSI